MKGLDRLSYSREWRGMSEPLTGTVALDKNKPSFFGEGFVFFFLCFLSSSSIAFIIETERTEYLPFLTSEYSVDKDHCCY